MPHAPQRLVVFTDARDLAPRILLPALLDALAGNPGLSCVGIVDSSGTGSAERLRQWRRARRLRRLQRMLGSGRDEDALHVPPLDLEYLAAARGIPLIAAADPNDARCLHRLRAELRADLGLNLYCRRRFGADLLGCFEALANYHNGRLPSHRGLRVSNWALYMGETASGFSFHRMEAGFDTGAVLRAGEVATAPGDSPAELELRKALAARELLPAVLEALCRRDPGSPQARPACEHTGMAWHLATHVADPASLSLTEWQRRLHGFLRVQAVIDGQELGVTALARCEGPGRLRFRSADGHWLRVAAIDFWPAWLPAVLRERLQ